MVVNKYNVIGDKHPQKRKSRQLYREPPERRTREMKVWRKYAQGLLREWGHYATTRTYPIAPTAVLLWEGRGRTSNEVLLVVASGFRTKSINPKTNDLLQVYILLRDEHPTEATKNGRDEAVCGNCRFRRANEGGCYTMTSWAPAALWRMYHAGRMPILKPGQGAELLKGAHVRFGAYGDPAAVDLAVWAPLLEVIAGHNSYTHQWADLGGPWRRFCMASVDNEVEWDLAFRRGWRTFRTMTPIEKLLPEERICPAISHHVPCLACNGCAGQSTPGRVSYVIPIHGPGAKSRKWTPCSTCNAQPGKPCTGVFAPHRVLKSFHKARKALPVSS